MSAHPIAILSAGLVTSVGHSAPATCAAVRAKIALPVETRYSDGSGQWLLAHQVSLPRPWRGVSKLAAMASMAMSEALTGVKASDRPAIPLLLCVAEPERPGRTEGLDDRLLQMVGASSGFSLARGSRVVADGRVSVARALYEARRLLLAGSHSYVAIVAVDSLISWPTLKTFLAQDRVLTSRNSNGFMPGESAGALLVSIPDGRPGLLCHGIGFGSERATIDSGLPLRADGMVEAVQQALDDAGAKMHDLDFRISDLSGEQYYFKEAALTLARTLKQRKATFDIWHPAESVGETGAAIGALMLAVAEAGCRKGYATGKAMLAHFSGDTGSRAACVLAYAGEPSEMLT